VTQPRPKVVHVSSVHRWTDNRIHYRECASLVAVGYDVTLVAVDSEVGGPDVGVKVIKLPRLSRRKRIFVGAIRAMRAALGTQAQIFHLHDPELVWAVPLLRVLGKKVIYDAHEDFPNQVKGKPYLPRLAVPVFVLAAHLVVLVARTSSHIVTATEAIAARYPAGRVTIVHNYPPLRDEETTAPDVVDRELAVAYIGAISETRGARVMVEAVVHQSFPRDWRLALAGSMPPALLHELSQMPGWNATEYHGQLPPPEARDMLLRSRLGLVLFHDTAAHRDALPTKMFEYFAAGIPVIASDFPLWRTIASDRECGILVDQSSPGAVASAIRRYAEDPDLLKRHSRNARRLAKEELNWRHEAEALLSVYSSLT
jgi:glycosyltransferase involved in cell wall biosynthesis